MSRRAALIALAALLAPAPGLAVTRAVSCSTGDIYEARPFSPDPARLLRFTTEALPKSSNDRYMFALWRFQSVSRRTGAVLSELRMYHGCIMGRGGCHVIPPSRIEQKDWDAEPIYSEVIALTRDFHTASGTQAPYAYVLPGFSKYQTVWSEENLRWPDVTLTRGEEWGPDLSDTEIWVHTGCRARPHRR